MARIQIYGRMLNSLTLGYTITMRMSRRYDNLELFSSSLLGVRNVNRLYMYIAINKSP